MNGKMNEQYEWSAECPLTRLIVDYVRETESEDENAVTAHVVEMVMDNLVSKVEVTRATAPFMAFCLRELTKMVEEFLDEAGTTILRELKSRMEFINVGVHTEVASIMKDAGNDTEKK